MSWTDEEVSTLKDLASQNKLFMSEIAKELNKDPEVVRWKAHQLGVFSKPKNRMGEWNSKHAHLREKVMKYFTKHTFEETADHFGLTRSELRSLLTVSYKDPKLAHIRKDKRRHDAWTAKELLFLNQHAGIKPRAWIAQKLKRGTMESVKESLFRLNTGSRYINGLPERIASIIVQGSPVWSFKTAAGAPGPDGNCHIRCVPWVALEREIKGKRIPSEYRMSIKAMARFQRWIHNSKSDESLIRKLKRMANAE